MRNLVCDLGKFSGALLFLSFFVDLLSEDSFDLEL